MKSGYENDNGNTDRIRRDSSSNLCLLCDPCSDNDTTSGMLTDDD